MKVMILMPLYKSMDAQCVISLIDFHQQLIDDGHSCKFVFTNGFNAAKARKALSKYAHDCPEKYDYVLWLDTDHIYRKEDFYSLVSRMKVENLQMLSATYKLHGNPETVHGITDESGFHHFTEDDLNKAISDEKVIDCQVVGFGFLLMTHEFLYGLFEKHGEKLFILDARENCTEDVKFCRVVLDDGFRVCFDPAVKVGHIEIAVRY